MKVLIVEDEIMAQRSLMRLLAQHYPDMDVVGTAPSVNSAVAWLKDPANSVDVIFMDVELADGICFEIFRQVDVKAKVIMTTAYDSYALKAFEAGSVDYLLKPVDAEALQRAVARVRKSESNIDIEALMTLMEAKTAPKKEDKERYIIRINDRIVPLNTSEIAYVYSEEKNNYCRTKDGTFRIKEKMYYLEEALPSKEFIRISNSAIININHVKCFNTSIIGRIQVKFKDGTTEDVSKRRTPEIMSFLKGRNE